MRWWVLLLLGSCVENHPPHTGACFIGADAGTETENLVATPALECPSRQCLHIAGFGPDLCTTDCATDEDCDSLRDVCDFGYVCRVPIVSGEHACRKLCVCADYVQLLDGGFTIPEACPP